MENQPYGISDAQMKRILTIMLDHALEEIAELREQVDKLKRDVRAGDDLIEWHAEAFR